MRIKEGTKKTVFEYVALNMLVLIALVLILELWKINFFKYPLATGGDATQVAYGFQQLKETGLFGYSVKSSYPYYCYMSDFPALGIVERFIRWLLVVLLDNAIVAMNLEYLAGYFLAASSAYWVLKKLGYSKCAAGISSILYSFLPYHFMRGIDHMGFSMYWPIPIFLYFMINYLRGLSGYQKTTKGWLNKDNVIHVLILVFMGGQSIYYSYFSCFFVCFVILCLLIQKKGWKAIKQPFIDLGIMLVTLMFTLIPYFINAQQYGANTNVADRSSSEIETFGLKIGLLIMPISNHRLSFLSSIKNKYLALPLTNENTMVALGVLFAIGFIYLLIELFKKVHKDDIILACSWLNFAAILLSTIGGVASVISLFFTQIRCYNRISIYIAFFAAVAFTNIMDFVLSKIAKPWMYGILCLLILAIGILDQTSPTYVRNYDKIIETWNSDENFIKNIEQIEGEEATIYQMPYTSYPEGDSRNDMGAYDQCLGYLHSDTLVWSFGCYTGRDGDKWNKYIEMLDLENQVKYIYINGFSGIYIDSYGYEENEFNVIKNELSVITSFEPICSENGRLYYFSLKNYVPDLISELDEVLARCYVEYNDGFYHVESDGYSTWNWCNGAGEITICNMTSEEVSVMCSMNINVFEGDGMYKLSVSVNGEKIDYTVVEGEKNEIFVPIILSPGENKIVFESNIPCGKPQGDDRELAFSVLNFTLSDKQYFDENID